MNTGNAAVRHRETKFNFDHYARLALFAHTIEAGQSAQVRGHPELEVRVDKPCDS